MQPLNLMEITLELFLNGLRQDRPAILPALAVPHQNLTPCEIEIFDLQRKCFIEPQSRSIQQLCHQRRSPSHLRDDALYFFSRQYNRQSFGPPGVNRRVDPIQLFAQDRPIEK